MINYKKIYQRFNEAKQVGIIYHITDYDGFKGIIESDSFGKSGRHTATTSFSRSKNFYTIPGARKKTFARFIADGNKLSEKYHIEPHADTSYFKDNERSYFTRYEAEERLFGRVVDAGKYIIKIEVYDKLYSTERYLLFKYLEKYPHIETNIDFSDFVDLNDINIDGIYENGKLIKLLHRNFDCDESIIDIFNLRNIFDEEDLQELKSNGPIYDTFTSEVLNGYDLVWTDPESCRIYVRTKNIENYDYFKKYNSEIVEMPYRLQFEDIY